MRVYAREEEGQRMQDQRLLKPPQTISRKLASLESSPIKVLKQQWRAFYGSEPPHRISRELLIRAVAYRNPGAGPRRTQTIHSKAPCAPWQ